MWNGIGCSCKYGYQDINGKCVDTTHTYSCPDNSFFNGASCQCNPGYNANGQGCSKCPLGNYWNGQGCGVAQSCATGFVWNYQLSTCQWSGYNCGSNQYHDGSVCRCLSGFNWINNECSKCPTGQLFDGISCVSGLVSRYCDDPYQFWNGFICVCVPGFWMVSNYCVTCPSTMQWNGYCCSVPRGLTRAVSSDPHS